MFDEKTILARLHAGEDAQTIANEMAEMMNTANKIYNDQKMAKAEADRLAAKKLEAQKKKELQEVLDMFADCLHISAKQISQLVSVEPHCISFDLYLQPCYLIRLINHNFSISCHSHNFLQSSGALSV
jgi:uncharacterized protein (UPF0335 family)